jgi:hypothetical protein
MLPYRRLAALKEPGGGNKGNKDAGCYDPIAMKPPAGCFTEPVEQPVPGGVFVGKPLFGEGFRLLKASSPRSKLIGSFV